MKADLQRRPKQLKPWRGRSKAGVQGQLLGPTVVLHLHLLPPPPAPPRLDPARTLEDVPGQVPPLTGRRPGAWPFSLGSSRLHQRQHPDKDAFLSVLVLFPVESEVSAQSGQKLPETTVFLVPPPGLLVTGGPRASGRPPALAC